MWFQKQENFPRFFLTQHIITKHVATFIVHFVYSLSELYKLKFFDWGGDYKNSLDKYLVSQYVKKFMSYDELICKFETEITQTVNGLCTKIIFEHVLARDSQIPGVFMPKMGVQCGFKNKKIFPVFFDATYYYKTCCNVHCSFRLQFEEINSAVQGYVLNSWYNHWSSILIEHLFWTHHDILPAIGQIKNVDFFLHGIPFDLKVTYLPEGYIKAKRKERKWPQEVVLLKQEAKRLGISFNKAERDSSIYYEITEKMRDKNSSQCLAVLNLLHEQRQQILNKAKSNPKELAKWLYENQGEMRFSAENRLFLVLVDSVNYEQSWKLKRNIDNLKPAINDYLNHFDKNNINRFELNFQYKTQSYTVLSDVIFVEK